MTDPQHIKEWKDSGITDSLIEHNLISTEGQEAYEYLIYAVADRRNDGRVRDNVMNTYRHTEKGGWWCAGVDPQSGERLDWGCFKPNSPRTNKDDPDKIIKYEHPPQVKTRLFALRVPYETGQKIADRFGCSQEYQARARGKNPTDADRHFWQWATSKKEIPLLVAEGVKKGAALLSNGYLAVALPGIWGAYRQDKDREGNKQGDPYLLEDIKPLVKDRDVVFAFDQDSKPKTRYQVAMAQKMTAKLLTDRGAREVSSIGWSLKTHPFKGVDDLIVARGSDVFDRIFQRNFERLKSLPVQDSPVNHLCSDHANIWSQREQSTVPINKLVEFTFEANIEDSKPILVPESTIYCRIPKNMEVQNLPPPTLTIDSMNYNYHCWKVHDASPREISKLQADLNAATKTTPVYGVPLPGSIDMFSGYRAEVKDVTAKSYSLGYLREVVPDRSPIIVPHIEKQPSINHIQVQEYSR